MIVEDNCGATATAEVTFNVLAASNTVTLFYDAAKTRPASEFASSRLETLPSLVGLPEPFPHAFKIVPVRNGLFRAWREFDGWS